MADVAQKSLRVCAIALQVKLSAFALVFGVQNPWDGEVFFDSGCSVGMPLQAIEKLTRMHWFEKKIETVTLFFSLAQQNF